MIIFFIVSLVAATVGAISGLGGGVLIKPVLDAVSGYPVAQISFMSACTVMTMSVVSLIRSKKGEVRLDGKRGTFLAIGAGAGGILGKQIFNTAVADLPGEKVGMAQSILLGILCIIVFIFTLRKDKIKRHNIQNVVVCLLLGMSLGTVSAFIGIGGGPINVMAISFFLGMDSKTTALHSIYAIFFSQLFSIIMSVVTGTVPQVDIFSLMLMILGGIGGAFIGSALSRKMSNKHVDKVFLVLLITVILISGYNFYNFSTA